MAPYSMDLRKRVVRAWDSGMDAESVAAKYEVSRAWVHRLVQRRRETGSIAPRKQTKFRRRVLADAATTDQGSTCEAPPVTRRSSSPSSGGSKKYSGSSPQSPRRGDRR